MKLIHNPDWGDNFIENPDDMMINVRIWGFGTSDNGAIILRSLKDEICCVIIPVNNDLWIRMYYAEDAANGTYMSYVIEPIENIIDSLGLDNDWHVIKGQGIINGHGLTKVFKSLGRPRSEEEIHGFTE